MIFGIVAIDSKNNAIGLNNGLPWKLKSDLQYFKAKTENNLVLMGYNTMLSLGKPLPNRTNFVIVKEPFQKLPNGFLPILKCNVIDFVRMVRNEFPEDLWVIGGAKTYELLAKEIDCWSITRVETNSDAGDTFLNLDLSGFELSEVTSKEENEKFQQPEEEALRYTREILFRKNLYSKMELCPKFFNKFLLNAHLTHHESFTDNFGKFIKQIVRENETSSHYHDIRHLVGTAYLAYIISRVTDKNPLKIVSDTFTMLFHDYQYASNVDDKVNIDNSITKFIYFYNNNIELFKEISARISVSPSKLQRKIIQGIQYTHYDFNDPNPEGPSEPKDLQRFNFIRGIDQLYSSAYFDNGLFNRLYSDLGKRFRLTFDAFKERNIKYLEDVVIKDEVIASIYKDISSEVIAAHSKVTLS